MSKLKIVTFKRLKKGSAWEGKLQKSKFNITCFGILKNTRVMPFWKLPYFEIQEDIFLD